MMHAAIENEDYRKKYTAKTAKLYKKKECLHNALSLHDVSHGYLFGKIDFSKSGYEIKEKDIWYSYDTNGNYHIVPDEEASNYIKDCNRRFEAIKTALRLTGGNNLAIPCKCHIFKCVNVEPYQYLISFNRLWYDADNHINNNFGQVQFMLYPYQKGNGQINRVNGDFKMMYPNSGEDGAFQFDRDSWHLTYNAPFTIQSCPQAIAKAFVEFIDLCEIMGKELNPLKSECNKR